MDLRTGETVWQLKNGPPAILPPLSSDLTCDVAIVGGGISGALIAYELQKSGLDCVIIDRREPGAGSTPASTAMLLYELDTPLCKLSDQIGEQEAVACYKASLAALRRIKEVAGELKRKTGDDCDFLQRESYYLAERKKDVPDICREFQMRKQYGFKVELLDKAGVEDRFPFTRPAALATRDAAEIDVVRFEKALLKASTALGLRTYGGTTMTHYRPVEAAGKKKKGSAKKFILETDTGCTVTAGQIVFATGYESEKYLGHKIGSLISTYAIATGPIADFTGWHERALVWTSARPYFYLRTTRDNRAVIGGGDIVFKNNKIRDALLPSKAAMLEKQLRELFPEMKFEVACAWAGTFGETPDSLARVGHPADAPAIHFAMGYGGNGITYSMLAADIIREACHGRTHPAAHLFRLDG